MHRIPRAAALCVVLIGALVISACTNSQDSGDAIEPASVKPQTRSFNPNQPVTVALLSPLTAQNAGAAALGRSLANAANLAADKTGDNLLRLKVYDTGGDPVVATGAARRAIAEGAELIIGPLFATSTRAAGEVAAPSRVPVIGFSTDSTVAGGGVYLSGFLPEIEAGRIIQYAKSQGYERIGILYPQTALGEVASRGAREVARNTGVRVVADQGYQRTVDGIQAGVRTFAPQASAAGARAVLLPDSGDGLRTVAAFLDANDLNPASVKLLGLGQWNSRSTLEEAALRGGWFPSPDPVALRRYVADYRRAFNETPPALSVLGYDAVRIAAQMLAAARQSGSNTPFADEVITRPQGFSGAVGPIRFLPDGRGERGLAILEVGQRSFETIQPSPEIFGVAGS